VLIPEKPGFSWLEIRRSDSGVQKGRLYEAGISDEIGINILVNGYSRRETTDRE
jgi:hypothetical protein